MIYVWIVAIERYGADSVRAKGPIDISEPIGRMAIELAIAFAKREPTATIILSVSLPDTDAYKAQLTALPFNITVTGAAQSDLRKALTLLQGSGHLLTYWVGHGIMSKDKRLVLTADSEGLDDLRAYDVDSILRHLRSRVYPRMQIGFFDACANVFPQATVTTLGGPGDVSTDQYFYFAASAGQVTPANTLLGGFSGTVISELTDPLREFPPDAKKLFADLRRRFDEARLSTRAFPLQWTEASGESWSRQGGAHDEMLSQHARAAWCTVGEFEQLRASAGGCVDDATLSQALREETLDDLLLKLRQTCKEPIKVALLTDAWSRLSLARALEDPCVALGLPWQDWLALQNQVTALNNLHQAPPPDGIVDLLLTVLSQTRPERGWDALVKLLGLAARRVRQTDFRRADAILEAVRRQRVLQPRIEEALASLPKAEGPVFLLIGLLYEVAEKKISLAHTWIYDADGELDPQWSHVAASGSSPVEYVNALIEIAKELYSDRTLIIELLAPDDLLCSPREFLELVDPDLKTRVWLEADNVIVLRWHNRMKGDARFQPGTWKRRAREIQHQLSGAVSLTCAWAGDSREGLILGLPFAGPSIDAPQRNRGEFFTELKRGVPFMCWPRASPSNLAVFKQSVCDFVETNGIADAPSDRLFSLAEALRIAKQDSQSDLLDLWMFVDDPVRNPYQKWHYVEPSKSS